MIFCVTPSRYFGEWIVGILHRPSLQACLKIPQKQGTRSMSAKFHPSGQLASGVNHWRLGNYSTHNVTSSCFYSDWHPYKLHYKLQNITYQLTRRLMFLRLDWGSAVLPSFSPSVISLFAGVRLSRRPSNARHTFCCKLGQSRTVSETRTTCQFSSHHWLAGSGGWLGAVIHFPGKISCFRSKDVKIR